MRQIVLDTETTGLYTQEGHRIIEIGCIELVNRKFTGKRYHQYINPEREVEEGALNVHGITNQFLKDKPLFTEIVGALMDFICGAELIIHNAPFDIGFLDYELSLTKQNWQSLNKYCRIIDTLVIARQLHTGQKNSLDALCKRYAVDNSQRDLHGALLDANLLAQVYLAMTGGQGSLFDDIKPADVAQTEKTEQVIASRAGRKLVVIEANSEELLEHNNYLQKLQEKGQCVWEKI